MAAFNWILVSVRCPACGAGTRLRAQTHVASDYGGDSRGRFHDKEYELGNVMDWWSQDDPNWRSWKVDGRTGLSEAEFDEEACRATCPACGMSLYVVIRFQKAMPITIIATGVETEWPDGYVR